MSFDSSSKIAIGSASFSLPYGASNTSQPTPEEVGRILEMCSKWGVNIIDTAKEYGEAESVIGRVRPNNLNVYTKLRHGTNLGDLNSLREQALESIHLLNLNKLSGLSVHDFKDFKSQPERAQKNLEMLKDEGLIHSWGVSLYELSELKFVLEKSTANFVQVPGNYLDRRFLNPQIFDLTTKTGVQLHVRSAFLQGVLLMRPEELPSHLNPLKEAVIALRRAAERAGASLLAFLLGFLTQSEGVSQVLVGLNTLEQAESLINALQEVDELESDFEPLEMAFASRLIDPRLWVN